MLIHLSAINTGASDSYLLAREVLEREREDVCFNLRGADGVGRQY